MFILCDLFFLPHLIDVSPVLDMVLVGHVRHGQRIVLFAIFTEMVNIDVFARLCVACVRLAGFAGKR